MKTIISPSILGGSFSNMEKTISELDKSKAEYIHFDVMDGDFVPNLTFGPQFISNVRSHSNKIFDVHLMVNRVQKFIDDYIKVFKKNKKGLRGSIKILAQVILGLFIGLMVYFHPEITTRNVDSNSNSEIILGEKNIKSLNTTVPFFKNNELDYVNVFKMKSDNFNWIFYVIIVTFIIVALSNGTNLTDGLDGLAAGSSSIIVFTLGIFSWISGNIIFSDYLNIMYLPGIGEIVVFVSALLGGLIGFLWYNTYPAQVFMGDTGSLTIGGIIAVIAILVRKELLLPILCGVFLIGTLSVIIQVGYFKYTKKKFGVGKRVFLMTPIHHHFQKKGYSESKIVARFWIISIMLAILSLITLKIR